MTPTLNPVEAILATIPAEAHPRQGPARLPATLEPGHRYGYRGGSRMGVVHVSPAGRLTSKPNGGLPATWAEVNADRLAWTHATVDCPGCRA